MYTAQLHHSLASLPTFFLKPRPPGSAAPRCSAATPATTSRAMSAMEVEPQGGDDGAEPDDVFRAGEMRMAAVFHPSVNPAVDPPTIDTMDFHDDGRWMVTADSENEIMLIDTVGGKVEKRSHSKANPVGMIRYTHHEQSVLCSSHRRCGAGLRLCHARARAATAAAAAATATVATIHHHHPPPAAQRAELGHGPRRSLPVAVRQHVPPPVPRAHGGGHLHGHVPRRRHVRHGLQRQVRLSCSVARSLGHAVTRSPSRAHLTRLLALAFARLVTRARAKIKPGAAPLTRSPATYLPACKDRCGYGISTAGGALGCCRYGMGYDATPTRAPAHTPPIPIPIPIFAVSCRMDLTITQCPPAHPPAPARPSTTYLSTHTPPPP